MSGWWLMLTIPAWLMGFAVACVFASQSYDRGWHDGHGRGWREAWIAATTPDTTND